MPAIAQSRVPKTPGPVRPKPETCGLSCPLPVPHSRTYREHAAGQETGCRQTDPGKRGRRKTRLRVLGQNFKIVFWTSTRRTQKTQAPSSEPGVPGPSREGPGVAPERGPGSPQGCLSLCWKDQLKRLQAGVPTGLNARLLFSPRALESKATYSNIPTNSRSCFWGPSRPTETGPGLGRERKAGSTGFYLKHRTKRNEYPQESNNILIVPLEDLSPMRKCYSALLFLLT